MCLFVAYLHNCIYNGDVYVSAFQYVIVCLVQMGVGVSLYLMLSLSEFIAFNMLFMSHK